MNRCRSLLCLAATLALAGCAWAQGNQTKKAEDQVQKGREDAKSSTYDQRGEYQQKLQGILDQLNREIGELERKAETAGAQVKQEYRRQLPELRRMRDKAQVELRKVKQSTPDAWKDLKQGANNALEDLRIAVDKAKKHFR